GFRLCQQYGPENPHSRHARYNRHSLREPEMLLYLPVAGLWGRTELAQPGAVAGQRRHFTQDTQPAAQEGPEAALSPAPPGLAGKYGGVARQGPGQVAAGKVPPEDP